MLLKDLISNGDFLTPTRANEWHLDSASFTLENGTRVEVLDTGVIQFTPKIMV